MHHLKVFAQDGSDIANMSRLTLSRFSRTISNKIVSCLNLTHNFMIETIFY